VKPHSVHREEVAVMRAENAGLPRGPDIEQPAIIKRILCTSATDSPSVSPKKPSTPEEPVKKKKKNK
jgi:hypothetical protein